MDKYKTGTQQWTLNDVINNQVVILSRLDRLEGICTNLDGKTRTDIYPPENLPVELPLQSLEEFVNFEEYLANQNNFKAMSTYLKSYTSPNLSQSIPTVMRELLRDEVASFFNYFGKSPKTKFNDTYLDKLLFCITRSATKCTKDAYKAHVMKWLKYAPQRKKYKSHPAEEDVVEVFN